MITQTRKFPTVGCCGIDCGLCPRFYTDGASRCPGCGGEGFSEKHPSCSFITCCVKKNRLEVCAECNSFPCFKLTDQMGERDSFVTHTCLFQNQNMIAKSGIEEFIREQKKRINFLKTALGLYDDGKSKGLFCLASAVLSIKALKKALSRAKGGEDLRSVLFEYAKKEQRELKLRK